MIQGDWHAIIVAGGSGKRMEASIPKQFIQINEKEILVYTVERFLTLEPKLKSIVLVLPLADIPRWKTIASRLMISDKRLKVIEGGKERFDSVKNGLDFLSDETGFVAIHDGVRPFISHKAIASSFASAIEYGSGVVSIPLKDSIRECNQHANRAIDRNNYRLIQTPQTFDLKKLKTAFTVHYKDEFTDDASVYEHAGHTIELVDGEYTNIKITTPEDLLLAEAFITNY